MADAKISQLPVATTPLAGTELVPIVQTATTKQTTVNAVIAAAAASGSVVASSDVGTAPNEIPLNQYLGTLAYQDATSVLVNALSATGDVVLGDTATDTVRVNGYMGVGGAGSAGNGVYVGSTVLTTSTQTGVWSSPIGTSSAISSVNSFIAQPQTAAASFTSDSVYGFRALNAIKGAGSTITYQYGFHIADQTQGTNNFGITSLVSSGANKWNIYASGTAQNYFGGRVGIGTTVPAGVLDANGTVYSRFLNTTAPTLDNDTHEGEAVYLRSGGTAGAENVQAVLAFGKADSASQRSGAAIASIQTTSDTDQIGLAFYVSPSTSSSQTMSERFRIGTSETVVNEASADYDFRVESDTNTHALFVEGTNSNVKIGGSAERATTVGTNHLDIFNGTAPVGTLSNGISIYSSAGEAYVMDAAGNATLFSPHDAETNEWIFKSKHTPTGKVLKIDVERLLRFVNDHFGLDAVQEFIEE